MKDFSYVLHQYEGTTVPSLSLTAPYQAECARRFHSTIPGYAPTPLVALDGLAKTLGVGKIWMKDESHRFGLNAFKSLGGSWAMANYLAKRAGMAIQTVDFAKLSEPEMREEIGDVTFVTATDGNHGRGVAWAAQMLGQRAVVFMPKGSAQERLENIRALGADAEILEMNYDDCVRHANQMAEENGWVLVQDTAWDGYEEIPAQIIQGYMTLAAEIADVLQGEDKPTHLFLQAGVGSFASAVVGYFACLWGAECPITVIVEPTQADCNYRTAKANDGKIHFVTGEMNSMMAGLCCGEPCTLSWMILDACAYAFISCGDDYAARGMRLLGRPVHGDTAIVSGESGAVGAGVLEGIMTEPALAQFRQELGLDATSRVLLISTEGDTDQENYRRILAQD